MFVIKKIIIAMKMFVNTLFMKIDIGKLISIVWMIVMIILLFLILRDVNYIMQLFHAYVSMAAEIVRH